MISILHWSPRSPYVRKVMVALHEKQLVDQVTVVRTLADPMVPPTDFFATNPFAKIPTLERPGHRPLFDSKVIMEWADLTSSAGPVLFPPQPEIRLDAQRHEALGTTLIDVAIALLIELRMRKPEAQDERVIGVAQHKLRAALDE